jgi:AcrR family transcriptional regulator
MTLPTLAAAIRVSPGSFRRQFADIDSLLADLVFRHLTAISRATGAIPRDTPNRRAAQRAAYLAYTRFLGGPTEAHILLIRERHNLPEDLQANIELVRRSIGEILAGDHGDAALTLLDAPGLKGFQIEAGLAAIAAAQPEARQTSQFQTSQPHNFETIPQPAAPEPAAPEPAPSPPQEISNGHRGDIAPAKSKQIAAVAKRPLAAWETGRPDADRWLLPWQRASPSAASPNAASYDASSCDAPGDQPPSYHAQSTGAPIHDAPHHNTPGDTPSECDATPYSALSDEALGDEALGDEALGDEAVGDEAVGDDALGDEVLSDEAPLDKALLGGALWGQSLSTGAPILDPPTSLTPHFEMRAFEATTGRG